MLTDSRTMKIARHWSIQFSSSNIVFHIQEWINVLSEIEFVLMSAHDASVAGFRISLQKSDAHQMYMVLALMGAQEVSRLGSLMRQNERIISWI